MPHSMECVLYTVEGMNLVVWVFYIAAVHGLHLGRYPELSFYMNSGYWSFTATLIYFCERAVEAVIQLKLLEKINNLKVAW